MENMEKGLTVPKCVLINHPKMPQTLSAQIVWPSPKVWDFDKKKRLHWASVVNVSIPNKLLHNEWGKNIYKVMFKFLQF